MIRQRGLNLSPETISEARKLIAKGYSWPKVAKFFGVSIEGLRRNLDHNYRDRRNERASISRRKIESGERRDVGDISLRGRVDKCDIPADVIADRDARARAPISMSAAFFGDPPQGYSALDGRGR
jgi:hypothetical protein